MPKGNPKPSKIVHATPGRKKGAKVRMSRAALDRAAQAATRQAAMSSKLPYGTPLEYMFHVLLDPYSNTTAKRWAAERAAPYVHRKMPLAIEGGDPTRPVLLATITQLAQLSPEQLRVLQGLSTSLSAIQSSEDVMKVIGETVVKANAIEDQDEPPEDDDD
jgi:hypothetical protein